MHYHHYYSTFFINMLYSILLLLSIAPSCFMEEDFGESKSTPSPPSLVGTAAAIEMVGPRDFQALSGNLLLWTRLSPLVFNLTGSLDQTQSLSLSRLSMQLFLGQGGEAQTLLATQSVPSPITTAWEKVSFPCNLIVQGGLYTIRLVRGGESSESYAEEDYPNTNFQILSNITINILYPTIQFEVPHRIEAYTSSTPITFGFVRSTTCEPKLPLPSTTLVLSICSPDPIGADTKTDQECNRDFATVFQDPLNSLQKEGRITKMVECHLWGRNATFRVQLRETSTKFVIAKSRPIQVAWGSQFFINMSKPTILPCRGSIRAIVSFPSCVLPGKDKIRVYGHETLSVPSLLVPSRLSYIAEHKIQPNNRVVTFRCNLFPQRFLKFCFQYINTAVDDSVTIVTEKCIPTNPPFKLAEVGWGPWRPWTPCTVTCGQDGRQFRYRFCDNPPPSSGANFCQGESIEERACDSKPECPPVIYVDTSGEGVNYLEETNEDPVAPDHHHSHPPHRHSLHQIEVENITLTPGCECGCILYDLVPGRNETLAIFISSNHSSPCSDEDEVDHHKFKWIFHTKDERDRVRLDVVEMEVQCVTITFRDGNTTDSNLLQEISSGRKSHYEEVLSQSWEQRGEEVFEPLTLESTGASLSISAFDSSKNCSGQFIYFIAYYSTLTILPNASLSLAESTGSPIVSYQFWTFLVLKLLLLFFVVVVVLSGFGGCVTKAYRKEKYKELKCFDNEDEGACSSDGGSNPGGGEDDSRCTSVTLMSFDYSYWRRMRLLRLKYFLLRPRPLNYISAKVKSFPSTPTRVLTKKKGTRACDQGSSSKGQRKGATSCLAQGDKSKHRLTKSISLSETNLRVDKLDISLGSRKGKKADEWPMQRKQEEAEGGADGAKSRMTKVIYSTDPLSIESTSVSNNSLHCSQPTRTTPNTGLFKGNNKLLKEKENLKRRGKKGLAVEYHSHKGKRCSSSSSSNKEEMERRREMTSLLRKMDIGKSQLSVLTTRSSCGEDESRVGSRAELEDADHDFEMDYYDYDVMNVGTIPGSYLGLEPAFVLWNSEVYQQEEQGEEEMGDCIPTTSSNASNNTSSSHEECDIEMTATTSSSSLGIFSDPQYSKRQITVRETSLDTLKFADEEDSDMDDNATQASDSIFDNNEQDLINEATNHHHHKLTCSKS